VTSPYLWLWTLARFWCANGR